MGKTERPETPSSGLLVYCLDRFLVVFFGLSSLGAGVLSIFLTASSKVVGGRMIGLPVRPAGLGVLVAFIQFPF